MNYANSSIQFSYEYELVDNSDLSTSYGYLNCVTGEPKITWSYDSELRCSATLDLDDTTQLTGYYAIRIWLIARDTNTGETERRMLGTFLYDRSGGNYKLGRETSTLDLYSMLYRHQTDMRATNTSISASTVCMTQFERSVENGGGKPNYDTANLSTTKTFGKSFVREAGEAVISHLQLIADTVGGYLGVNPKGEITMTRYIPPAQRINTFELKSTDYILASGINIAFPKIINKVVATYTYNSTSGGTSNTVVLNASSQITEDAHPWSFANLKVWKTEVIQPDTVEQNDSVATIQQKLQIAANQRLAEILAQTSTLTIKTIYNPALIDGAVGTVEYADSPNSTPLRYRAVINNIEMTCNAGAIMTLTLGVLNAYN